MFAVRSTYGTVYKSSGKRYIANIISKHLNQLNTDINKCIESKIEEQVPLVTKKYLEHHLNQYFESAFDTQIETKVKRYMHEHLYRYLDVHIDNILERPDIQHRIQKDIKEALRGKIEKEVKKHR